MTTTEIVAGRVSGYRLFNLRELWAYRELLFFLTWRDVKIRYKQTILGVLWAILQPVLMMVVFTVVFGRMAKVPTGSVPYPIFVYAGLLPWTFFSRALSAASDSVVKSERLVTKIYFPRIAIPIASVGAAFVDLAIAFLVLLGLMIYYDVAATWSLLLIPLLCILATCAALGFGTLLAALNVAYRDVRYVVPYFIQIWLFATPSVYMEINASADAAKTPEPAVATAVDSSSTEATSTEKAEGRTAGTLSVVERLLGYNPMTGLIAFFRAAVMGKSLDWSQLAYSAAVIVVFLVGGVWYFQRLQTSFADIV